MNNKDFTVHYKSVDFKIHTKEKTDSTETKEKKVKFGIKLQAETMVSKTFRKGFYKVTQMYRECKERTCTLSPWVRGRWNTETTEDLENLSK